MPQAPQLLTSVCVFTSQPLAGLPSQSAKPALQVVWHCPDEQNRDAFAAAVHTLPSRLGGVALGGLVWPAHQPQLFGSTPTLVQTPLQLGLARGDAQETVHL